MNGESSIYANVVKISEHLLIKKTKITRIRSKYAKTKTGQNFAQKRQINMNFFSNSFVLDFVLSCFCKTNQFSTHISPSDRKHEISWNVMHRLPCIVYVSTNFHFEPKRFFMRLSILLLFQLTQKSKRYIFNKNETKFDKMYLRRVHSKKRL